MMKKLLLLVCIITIYSTSSYGQYILDFEDTSKFGATQQSNGAPHTEVTAATNPVKAGINTSDNSLQFTETAGALYWEFGFLSNSPDPEMDGNSFGFALNETNGKILKLKVLSVNETDFELKLQPYINGAVYNGGATQSLSSINLNTWYEVTFDFSAAPDGWVPRVDVWFNPTGGTRDGDIFYIDDLAQVTTLGTKTKDYNSINIHPNPVSNTLKITDYQKYKHITIHNLLGQELKTLNSKREIDVSDLKNGIYILKTDTGNTSKFIKK
ncbi:T9SS type A sorting domain-containing protein [Seonamhaeicola algicola]|uniref:T9SS type A sorting domain-containing protein n=1 Tax=Seonamhaeicola algicola TaxID=1719036 RepID=A0A5C7AR94_9FLAO|nr:T9SS type A sorting domain-containing protein [Seonamhaeicola algicola]TXE10133.1 T9SS type A sorting domain-containing protein [Seonamhaeicola algicola]